MKFLFFGDKHERATTPENRIGDYQHDMLLKTQEIIDIGKEHEVTAFLQPGDFWDSPNPPLDYASEVMKRWTNIDLFNALGKLTSGNEEDIKEITNSFKKDYIPMVGVVGNHELFGNNIKTLPKTMAGFINKLGLMQFATKENPVFFTTEDGLKIAITGTHYHLDIDSPEYIDDYVVKEKLGDYHIHIIHGMLSDKDMGEYIRHTLIDSIRHTKADITLAGHDHIGFPITEVDGKYFVNPGAIPRLSNDLKEIGRQPKVLLIDINRKDGIKLTEIPLKSAKKGELVLDRKKITEKKAKEAKLEEFKTAVRKAGIKKSADITEIVRDIADNQKLPQEVKDSVVKRLSEKMVSMNHHSQTTVDNIFVEKIILENFQSHEYTELNLSKGFNVLVGESGQGKSSILRAFNLVYENKPRGKRYIRKGAEYARVSVVLSNGYIIERFVEGKNGGKNGYYITDPNTGEREFHNTKILPEVQKILGFTTLNIDKDLELNLNFLKQGTGWFLIGDHISAPSKAKVIGGIYGTQYADAVLRDLENEERKIRDKSKDLITDIANIDKEIEQFDHLKDLKVTIDELDLIIEEIKRDKAKKLEIEAILEKRSLIEKESKENEEILSHFKSLDKTYELLIEIKSDERKLRDLNGLILKHEDLSKKLKNIEMSLESVSQIDSAYAIMDDIKKDISTRESLEKCTLKREKIVEDINTQSQIIKKTELIESAKSLFKNVTEEQANKKTLLDKVERAESLETKKKSIEKSLKAIDMTIDKTKDIESARNQLVSLIEMKDRRSNIYDRLKQRESIQVNIEAEVKLINDLNNKTKTDIEKYKEVLSLVGKCPICLGTIDKATVNRIVAEYTNN